MTLYAKRIAELKATLQRLEDRRFTGRATDYTVSVEYDLLEDLIQDHEDLQRLLAAHPELKSEVPYA